MDTISAITLALYEIDRLLTGHCHNPDMKEREIRASLEIMDHYIYYLSDGGFSRLVIRPETATVTLTRGNPATSGSLPTVVERFDNPSPELKHQLEEAERLLKDFRRTING